MATLYLSIKELVVIDDESVKQVRCRIGDEHLSRVCSYPASKPDEEIKNSVMLKLANDGYVFDDVQLE